MTVLRCVPLGARRHSWEAWYSRFRINYSIENKNISLYRSFEILHLPLSYIRSIRLNHTKLQICVSFHEGGILGIRQ
jgi:hypothetical protein